MVIAAGLVGATFPAGVQKLGETGMTPERAAALVYAVDIFGGATGALFLGGFLLPLQGSRALLLWLALCCAVTMIGCKISSPRCLTMETPGATEGQGVGNPR